MRKFIRTSGWVILFLIIYFFAQLIVSTSFGFFYGFRMGLDSAMNKTELDQTVVAQRVQQFVTESLGTILIIAAVIAFLFYFIIIRLRNEKISYYCVFKRISLQNVLLCILMGIGFSIAIGYILNLLNNVEGLRQAFDKYNELTGNLMNAGFLSMLLSVGILIPIFEEILFRGFIFTKLKNAMRVGLAVVLQAVVFGVYHMNLIQAAYAAILGVIFAVVYIRTGSIISSMLIHIALNTTSVFIAKTYLGTLLENNAWLFAILSVFLSVAPFVVFMKISAHKNEGTEVAATNAIQGADVPVQE